MTKETQFTLPDFRNLGILLRAVLVLQLFGLLAALVNAADLAGMFRLFFGYAAYLEPPLLCTVLLLYLFAPRLSRLPARLGLALSVLISMFSAAFWQIMLEWRSADAELSLTRTLLLAGVAAALILVWFDWRARRLSPALAEARLQALQARIRPHFLFNCINSVLSLMRSNPARAETALENLADLYRGLMADNRQLSPLGREIELARAYLDLESLRLGERLQVDWRIDSGVEGASRQLQMPSLVLQPLLENAVCHGIEPHPEGGRIGVDIFQRDQQLNIVVRNPRHADAPPRPGNRMALSNIRERLALHFDAEARLSAHQVGDEFVVQMVIPMKETT
jgi:two-component system sensor histidine kinase AlgZ